MNFLKIIFSMIALMIFFTGIIFAQKVEITSDSMNTNTIEKKVYFIGNVKIKQLNNWLHGNKVIVHFNENNETDKYEAIGAVTFEFKEDTSLYKGSANKVIYYPLTSKYILKGKAVIDDILNKRHVNGELITLDMLTSNIKVQGNKKKPVKFIFDLEKKK